MPVLSVRVSGLKPLQSNFRSTHVCNEHVENHCMHNAARSAQECTEMQQLIGTVTSEGLKGDFQYPQGDQHAPFLP